MHAVCDAVPLTDHLTATPAAFGSTSVRPLGAVAPVGPVKVRVNTAVPFICPSPTPVIVATGATFAIVTVLLAGSVVGNEVKLLSPG